VVVACEPAEVDEVGMELSAPVQAAVESAIGVVHEQIEIMRVEARAEQRQQQREREAAS
jgi:Ni,Fe-hydrogenase maturation factor